jgi:hypothetical protein
MSQIAAGALTTAPKSLDVVSLLQFGFVGFVLVCILARKFLVPEWVYREAQERNAKDLADERERNEKLTGQLERLQNVFQDQMIPALTRSTEVNATYNEELAHRRYSSGVNSDQKS